MDSAEPTPTPNLRFTPDEARAKQLQPGQLSAPVFTHGSMELRWMMAKSFDPQVPHDRDELYFVANGTAVMVRSETSHPFTEDLDLHGEHRVSVQPGDTLFIPAGTAHRFEAMSADFGACMVFYGPEGGER